MAQNPPVWMQAGTYSAEADRMVTSLLVDRTIDVDGNLTDVEGGVVPPKDQLNITPVGGTSMQFRVGSGMAIIPAKAQDPPGVYLCYNSGNFTGTIDIAGGQPRFDLVIAEVRDTAMGDPANEWRFRVIKGDPGPNPTAPATPNGAIAIARIKAIPSAQNGGQNKIAAEQIFDLRRFTASGGGVHLTWKDNPNPRHSPGRVLYDASNKSLYLSDGAKWDPLYTYPEWLSYFAAYRIQQVAFADSVYVLGDDNWIAKPKRLDNDNPIGNEISIGRIATPTGRMKISLLGFGRVIPTTNGDTTSGHLSVSVSRKSNGHEEWEPEVTRGIGWYTKSWAHIGGTFLVVGLPDDEDLEVALRFTRRDDPGKAIFSRIVMTAEPVI